MLLNSTLTVREGEPGSHKDLKWDQLTDLIIKKISDNKEFVVFILMGNFAKSKVKLIDRRKHGIIETAHPSPLSAYKFFGSKPFTSTNSLLQLNKLSPIDWINIDGKKDGLFAKVIRNMR
jgi:uracil-DNA glycosylase